MSRLILPALLASLALPAAAIQATLHLVPLPAGVEQTNGLFTVIPGSGKPKKMIFDTNGVVLIRRGK